nr:sortase B protein-sorting domain-containing protein [bacterium]
MNKRIASLALVFILILTMLATAVSTLAAPSDSTCTYSIEADKTSANPGDIINFTIYMQQTGTMNTLEGTLVIPDGLTFVADSGVLTDGIRTTLGWDSVEWTPVPNMILNGYGSVSFTGTGKLALMKFQCTVDSNATAKNYEVKLIDLVADDENYDTKNPTCIPATVAVTLPHTHVYDQETLNFLVSPATCTSPAVYHKSCACGAEGTETFTSGVALSHDYTKKVENEDYLKLAASNCTDHNVYWFACSRCDANAKDDAEATDKYYTSDIAGNHSFTEQLEDAAHYVAGTGTDCQSVKKYYYDCAYCDLIGTNTWDSTTYGPHNYATTWSRDASGHWHECSLCHDKKDGAVHTPDREAATETDPIKCSICHYIIEAQLEPKTPVTNIAATITAPKLGATPDYHPVYASTPEGSVEMYEITWYKIAIANFTGTDEDGWDEMESDEAFTTGYYYSVDMFFDINDGYKLTESATGTVNGKPHDSTYGVVFDGLYEAYLSGLFEPLLPEYTIDLPVSIAVKLTGDKKPAKETFKFEIYDLGCEDAEFEIVNDAVVVENLEFDENGVAFAGGIIKMKVTGEDQLCNLTEGFKIRMVKGSTEGWTYASEQWYIELFFENDALDFGIGVKEIVDGEISEVYANGMSFATGYEAVIVPDPIDPGPTADPQLPQTGDNSMMGLWLALLFVSGVGVAGITIYGRKKKYSAR